MKITPKKILWPTDFSKLSMKAAEYAAAFCDAFEAELHVVHVCVPLVSPYLAIPHSPAVDFSMSDVELAADAKLRLQRITKEVFAGRAPVVYEALVGAPWAQICDYAKRGGIDLIVIATHGLTGLHHVLIGSTAERVVQHAPCPVLSVKNVEKDFVVT
ncbi:MAG: universal stress protein [Phycisphaerae bacterium]|nr:universal stress protein [Phycisphaerae bacterium]